MSRCFTGRREEDSRVVTALMIRTAARGRQQRLPWGGALCLSCAKSRHTSICCHSGVPSAGPSELAGGVGLSPHKFVSLGFNLLATTCSAQSFCVVPCGV